MGRIITFLVFLFFVSGTTYSQYKLDIEITGIKSDKGKIMLQLLDSDQKVIREDMGIITDNKCTFLIDNLSAGKYAVRYYHDENQNGKMESNLVGKPTEGYGFSNNVIGKFGPPPFEKWLFEIKDDKKIFLKPTY